MATKRGKFTLPRDLWRLIYGKLSIQEFIHCTNLSAEDYIRFTQPRGPWLMLSGSEVLLRFLDMVSGKVHKVPLTKPFRGTYHGASEGWLILSSTETADIRLFNIFTRAEIELPPTSSFPGIVRTNNSDGSFSHYDVNWRGRQDKLQPYSISNHYFGNALLNPCFKRGYIVVVRYKPRGLAFARAGDKVWTDLPHNLGKIEACMMFKGVLYASDSNGRVFTFDFNSNTKSIPLPKEVAPSLPSHQYDCSYLEVLPESGELLQVTMKSEIIRTFKLKKKTRNWIDVKTTLDGHSFCFMKELAPRRSQVRLAAKDVKGQVEPNCMYMIDEGAIKVWDMEDQKMKPYCWTTESMREIGMMDIGRTLTHPFFGVGPSIEAFKDGLLWTEPVLSSLSFCGDKGTISCLE